MPATTRPTKIATVVIPVSDQDRLVDFYVDALGFEKRVDVPFGNGMRWVEVGLEGEATTIALAPPPEAGQTGGRETGISLHADDIDAYHERLRSAGVDVDEQVQRWGDPVPPILVPRPRGQHLDGRRVS